MILTTDRKENNCQKKPTLLRTGVPSVSLLAWAGTAAASTVFEDFNTDPAPRGSIGVNGPTTAGNNFGWSRGSAIVPGPGNEGEMGGVFARSAVKSPPQP